MACRRNFFCRYALGAPVVGSANVIYSMRTTLCRLMNQDLFIVTIPASTTSTLPPQVQLCNGTVLPIVFSSTEAAAQASGLLGQRAYLATIICVDGAPTLNILNAMNAATASA